MHHGGLGSVPKAPPKDRRPARMSCLGRIPLEGPAAGAFAGLSNVARLPPPPNNALFSPLCRTWRADGLNMRAVLQAGPRGHTGHARSNPAFTEQRPLLSNGLLATTRNRSASILAGVLPWRDVDSRLVDVDQRRRGTGLTPAPGVRAPPHTLVWVSSD